MNKIKVQIEQLMAGILYILEFSYVERTNGYLRIIGKTQNYYAIIENR